MACVSSLSERGHELLATTEWFASLPEDTRAAFFDRARLRRASNGERIYSRGDRSDGFYVVFEGILRLSGVSKAGRETILDFYPPGSLVGEVSMLAGTTRTHDAEAYGRTLLLRLRIDDADWLVDNHPAFGRALLRLEAQRLQLLLVSLEQYSVQTLEQRLASRFLLLKSSFGIAGSAGVRLDLKLSQETLARLTGATRQRINQILMEWEDQGLVHHKSSRITLQDISRLAELAKL